MLVLEYERLNTQQKILIVTYYWPPSGGSGVQRWMYFAKYLKQLGWEPIVVTVDEEKASYAVLDTSLNQEVDNIRVIKTNTREPLQWYSFLTSGSRNKGIPQGEVNRTSIFRKFAAYIRGNFFIPDARKGWVPFALKAARKIIIEEKITQIITTGPPHSTHLVGLQLQQEFDLNWLVDFRDPWSDLFYNKELYRSQRTIKKDLYLETQVLRTASGVLTTIGGKLHEDLKLKAPLQNLYALPNGYDAELMQSVEAKPIQDMFHVVYTGLLTHNQPYDTVLKVLNSISTPVPIRLSLAGTISPEIRSEIQAEYPKIEVVYHGYLSHKDAIGLMKSAHLLLNFIFLGAQTQMISGKLLEYIATEIPILSIGNPDSEAGCFLKQGTAATMLDENDTNAILDFIQIAVTQKDSIRNTFPQLGEWSREALTKQLIEILER
jgi:glycosyltransferase involved in cell wall biosynthesis